MRKKKVIIAMSGGIDSSVAAALLKRAGLDIIGVFMRFWMAPENKGLTGSWNRCCTPEAEARARKVAKILKIPFYVFNFEKEFKKRIVDYFLDGCKKGITPNPCVVCNKEIKFGLLLKKALSLNADFVATGHYALKREIKNLPRTETKFLVRGQKSPKESLWLPTGQAKIKNYQLLKAKDKKKDQSYFLWMLNQEQLKRILFPIGDLTRKEVENLAKKFKLPVLDIKKSVEICFIKTTINDFLKKYLKEKPGPVVEQVYHGVKQIVGKHRGLWFYTIGQRKGIKLPGGPYWVLDKDLKKNILIVTRNGKDLYRKELIAKKVNWVAGKSPKFPLKVKVKIRYRHQSAFAIITKNPKSKVYLLRFKIAQRAITPGQSVVFYKREELLGGGIIC